MRDIEGDGALLQQMAAMFAREYPVYLQRIDTAIAEGDAEQLTKAAHRFRGMLSTLRFIRAAQTAAELEELGISSELEGAPAACERLREDIDQVLLVFEAQVALLTAK